MCLLELAVAAIWFKNLNEVPKMKIKDLRQELYVQVSVATMNWLKFRLSTSINKILQIPYDGERV